MRANSSDVNVEVRLYGILREKAPPDGRAELLLAVGSTINDVVERLAVRGHVQTAVNGQVQPFDTILADGDIVEIFRAAAGG